MPTFDKKNKNMTKLTSKVRIHTYSFLGGGNTYNPRSWFWRKPNFGISHGKKAQDSTRSERGSPSYKIFYI